MFRISARGLSIQQSKVPKIFKRSPKKQFSPMRSSVAGAALYLHGVGVYPASRGTVIAFCIRYFIAVIELSS
jgi:hypothetical protein